MLTTASESLVDDPGRQRPPASRDEASRRQAASRKLHIGHFAFMRAVVQGLDTRDSWNRYLRVEGEHDDIRNVKRTIQWIRDEFAAAARRSERHGTARLILIDAERVADDAERIPTLEEFAIEHGLEEFSQAEQLEQYRDHYGAASAGQSRRRRLIAKQLDALRWLEELAVQPPRAHDPVASWLNPELAAHLEAAGLPTLGRLVERINGIGFRWWAGIDAIGASKAVRIVSWLRAHQASIGTPIGEHVEILRSRAQPQLLQRVVPKATAIVPLDKLLVPRELDGSNGRYRLPQASCLIDARDDYHAVLAWIKAKQGAAGAKPAGDGRPSLSHTQRAYLKEAERFMLWAIVQKKKPLSSMDETDCGEYLAFLSNPAPAELWCGRRGREKWSPLWRPFEGPLSDAARSHAGTVLKSLYAFLVQQCYLSENPWARAARSGAARKEAAGERRLTATQWAFVEQRAARLPPTSANRRLTFALRFFRATGLRLAEAVAARVDDLRRTTGIAGGTPALQQPWTLTVAGQGTRTREVLLPPELVQQLSDYLASRGLHPDPDHELNRGAFLLGKAVDLAQRAPWSPPRLRTIDPKDGVAPGTLYDQLKAFFADCADAHAVTDPNAALRLATASTRWLRGAQTAC
jgi:integrase